MVKAALKGLLARKLRLALAGLAVVLGVMAVAAAMVTTTTIGSGFDSIFATATTGIDVSVTGKSDVQTGMGGKGFTPPVAKSVVSQVADVPGVRQAVGEVTVDGARPVGKDGKVIAVQGPPRSGVAWHGETGMVRLREGRGPKADTEVAINAGLAERGQFHVGDDIDVLTLAPRQTFTIVGIYGFSNGKGTMGGDTQVAFPEPVAQQLMLGRPGTYSSITVTADGVSNEVLRDRIAKALGGDYTVRTGDELAATTAADGKAFGEIVRMILLGFSGLSLLVGIFLILNTFSILVAQRTGELALMAALGARRRQIIGAVLVEASIVGVVASAVGIGLGIGISALLTMVMEAQSGTELPVGLMVPVPDMVIAFLIGVGVTLVAALAPAVRASRIPPVAAMTASAAEQRSLTKITALGAAPAVVGIGSVVAAVLFDLGSFKWVALAGGVVLGLAGIALLTPIASRTLLPILGRVMGWSMPSKLGRRNAARNPRRTAITVATLVVTLGLVGGVGVVAQSLRADLSNSATRGLGADLVISGDGVMAKAGGTRSGPPTAADGRIMPTFAASVIDKARALPGVSNAVAQYVDTVQLQGPHGATATPAAAGDIRALASVLGIKGSVRSPTAGEVVVDKETLTAQGLHIGDNVRLATQRLGWQDYRIVDSYDPSYLLRGPVFAQSDAAKLFVTQAPALGYVTLADGADAAATTRAVSQLVADNPEVTVADQTQLANDAASQIDIAETMLYVLLGLSVVIGILGIVNTMALSILERTRELGLLRAIGMRRSHLVHMVTAESVVMAVFGALLGLVAGGLAGAAAAKVIGLSSIEIPWMSLVVFLGLAVVAGLLAALAPSARAAKVNVLSAIAYE